MAPTNGNGRKTERPRPLHTSKSFSRIEPASPDRPTRSTRASTIQNVGVILKGTLSDTTSTNKKSQLDAFENGSSDDEDQAAPQEETGKLPADFDELPIELVSLSDRYIQPMHNTQVANPPRVS
jgi:hypothetical protein